MSKKKSSKKNGSETPFQKMSGFSELQTVSGVGASMVGDATVIGHKLKTVKEILGEDQKTERTAKTIQDTLAEFDVAVLERAELSKYGWGSFTPPWLQWCCTPAFLIFSLSFIGVAQGFFVHGVLPSSVVPITRRFKLSMLDVGATRLMYDVGMILGFIPVMYYNARGAKRPRWLGIGCMIMGLGAFLCAVPHFRSDEYLPSDEAHAKFGVVSKGSMSDSSENVTVLPSHGDLCTKSSSAQHLIFFMIGFALNGLGASAYFTMGIAFLDENVSHQTSVLFTGIINSAMLLGSMLAFFANAEIIDHLWVDVSRWLSGKAPSTDPSKPDWVGAWWVGMLMASGLSILSGLPMFGFPRRLPGAAKARIQDQDAGDSLTDNPVAKNNDSVRSTIRKSVKACLTNPVYLGMVVEQITFIMLVTSFASFMPLYLRSVYGILGRDSRYMAGCVVAFALVGSMVGTLLQHLLKLGTLENLKFSLATAWATLVFLGVFIVRCEEFKAAVGTISYPVDNSYSKALNFNLTAPCNRGFHCDRDDFQRLCYRGPHPDKKLYTDLSGNRKNFTIFYFSSCYAGCPAETFTNCSCVPNNTETFEGGGSLTRNCPLKKCWYRAVAATLGFCWCAMAIFIHLNPMQQALLRCIPAKDRVVGLVMCAFVSRVFGAIPAPVLMGAILEQTCVMEKDECRSGTSECVWRDGIKLQVLTTVSAYGFCILGAIGLSVAYYSFVKQSKLAELEAAKGDRTIKVVSSKKCSVKKSVKGASMDV